MLAAVIFTAFATILLLMIVYAIDTYMRYRDHQKRLKQLNSYWDARTAEINAKIAKARAKAEAINQQDGKRD
jgi:hypothetical protein